MYIVSFVKFVICWLFKILFYLILLRLLYFCCIKLVIFGNVGRILNDIDIMLIFNCKVYLVIFIMMLKFCYVKFLSLYEESNVLSGFEDCGYF